MGRISDFRRAYHQYQYFRFTRNASWRGWGVPLLWDLYRAQRKS